MAEKKEDSTSPSSYCLVLQDLLPQGDEEPLTFINRIIPTKCAAKNMVLANYLVDLVSEISTGKKRTASLTLRSGDEDLVDDIVKGFTSKGYLCITQKSANQPSTITVRW